MRYETIVRQWRALKIIDEARGVTVEQLSKRLNIPLRTAYRDVECLLYAGFPLYTEKRSGKRYWRFVDGYRVGTFNAGEGAR